MTARSRAGKGSRPRARPAPASRPLDRAPVAPAPASATWQWGFPLACGLVTVAAFWPSLQNQFLDWDDAQNLVDNAAFRGLGWSNLRWMFTTTLMGHWIPVTWITFGVDHLLWGMNPVGYHLTNLLLHAGAAVLFYFVALRLLRAATATAGLPLGLGALAGALFFAIHPLRVESVAWVTERRDVLSGVWFMLTIVTYLEASAADGVRRRRWLVVSVVCYALGVMSKAVVMTLPVVLVILDIYPLRRLGGRRGWRDPSSRPVWAEKIPYVSLAIVGAAIASYAVRSVADMIARLPLETHAAVVFYGLGFYVRKTLIPVMLSPLYQLSPRLSLADAPIIMSAASVLGLTGALIRLRRRWPAGLAVWVSYVVLLAPVSGVVQSGPQIAADRYTYLPCLGFALLGGGAVCWLARAAVEGRVGSGWARAGGAIVIAALLGLGILSWRQTRIWRDPETFWSYVVSLDPSSPLARDNRGLVYLNQGRLGEAEREIRAAVRLAPEWEKAQENLAVVLARQSRLQEAEGARVQLGYLLLKHGKYGEAVGLFRREVRAHPGDAGAHNNLGAAFLFRGDVGPAIEQFEEALRLDPGHEKARRNLAAARQPR